MQKLTAQNLYENSVGETIVKIRSEKSTGKTNVKNLCEKPMKNEMFQNRFCFRTVLVTRQLTPFNIDFRKQKRKLNLIPLNFWP